MNLRARVLSPALGIFAILISCMGQDNKYLSTFQMVWKKVNETYYDSTFGGLNWKDAYNRYLQRINTDKTDEDFYRHVNDMLWELKVSHTNLIRPGNMARYEPLVCAEGSPSFNVRILKGEAVITYVKPESPAHEAGLRPGYVIQAVDRIPVKQIINEAELLMRPPFNNFNRTGIVTKALIGRIYGTPGTEVSIIYRDEKGEKSEKKLMRTKRSGAALGPNGIIYLAIDFETRLLENGIGYIRLNTFQQPLAPQISNAIKSMGNVSAVIFDLRGNSGGEIEEIPDLFLNVKTLLYIRNSRDGETKMFFEPAENSYKGPLVLLIDQLSGSASELFAGCMQALGRAVVIGERSPGAVMESDMMIFPTGALFMYPVAQLATPDGTILEGHGVVPDIEVGLDREMLLKGIDTQIESAIRYIEKDVQK